MNTFSLINILLLIAILIIAYLLIYRFDRRVDQVYFRMYRLNSRERSRLGGLSKLESVSIAWVLGLVFYKYIICPWRHIDTAWFNRQIWYGVILFLLIELAEGIMLYRFKQNHKK